MTDDKKWEVHTHQVGDTIKVYVSYNFTDDYREYVGAPNFVERLFGITFENKIARAMARCRSKCDEHNIRDEMAKRALSEFTVNKDH